MNKNKTLLIITITLAVLVIGSFIILTIFKPKKGLIPSPVLFYSPSPSSTTFTPDQDPGYNAAALKISQDNQLSSQQSSYVAQLIKKLPYKGTNFSLSYTFDTNQFLLVLFQGREDQGYQELDQYLKSNNVQSKDWLYNLVTKTK